MHECIPGGKTIPEFGSGVRSLLCKVRLEISRRKGTQAAPDAAAQRLVRAGEARQTDSKILRTKAHRTEGMVAAGGGTR